MDVVRTGSGSWLVTGFDAELFNRHIYIFFRGKRRWFEGTGLHLPGEAEDNHEILQLLYPDSRPGIIT